MKKFQFLPHTADIKIRVYGKNIEEIINNSLLALSSYLKPKLTKQKIERKIKLKAETAEDLIDFLSQVLARIHIDKAIFIKFKQGKIRGYKFSELSKDIKAITYHQTQLKKTNNRYIFDFIIDI
ncbi:MAG: archease [Candidatus Parcubacteria bacterium]|nr:MAG: archease [Candidatus Parcubacteria bacterium]